MLSTNEPRRPLRLADTRSTATYAKPKTSRAPAAYSPARSSTFRCFEIAGWLIWRASAAREKLPVLTTVVNRRSKCRFKDITSLYRARSKIYYPIAAI